MSQKKCYRRVSQACYAFGFNRISFATIYLSEILIVSYFSTTRSISFLLIRSILLSINKDKTSHTTPREKPAITSLA
jgi:hypothetical protein